MRPKVQKWTKLMFFTDGRLATTLVYRNFHRFFTFFHFFFSVTNFFHRRSARITKPILRKLFGAPDNLGWDPFPDPVGHFGAPGGHFGICRRWGIAGGEFEKKIQQLKTLKIAEKLLKNTHFFCKYWVGGDSPHKITPKFLRSTRKFLV